MKKIKTSSLFAALAVVLVGFFLVSFTIVQKPWEVPAKYKSMKSPTKADAGSIELGKALYSKHCKGCHGATGMGDGVKAAGLSSKIRSFKSVDFKKQTPGDIYYKSFVGRNEMPNFEKKIVNEEDRWALLDYIATLK